MTISLSSPFAKKINKQNHKTKIFQRKIESTRPIFSRSLVLFLSFVFSTVQADTINVCGDFLKKALTSKTPTADALPPTCNQTRALIEWLGLRAISPSFSQISTFLDLHPEWPLKESLQQKAEASLLASPCAPAVALKWFAKNPPVSCAGIEAYCDALLATNKKSQAYELIKKEWSSQDMPDDQQQRWVKKYSTAFSQADYFNRAVFLLNNEKDPSALLPFLSSTSKEIVDVRFALIKQKPDAEKKLKSLPRAAQENDGIIYDRIKWLRRQERNSEIVPIFTRGPAFKTTPAPAVWKERNLLTRWLMDEKRYKDAYTVVKSHGLTSGEDFATGEWLAGWLCLRFLKDIQGAERHFDTLHKGVKAPISVARAAYWLGRTYEALKNAPQAKLWFEKAHLHPATYYGQLAYLKTHGKPLPVSFNSPKVCLKTQEALLKTPLYQIITLLGHTKAPASLLEPFFIHAAARVKTGLEQDVLVTLAHRYTNKYGCVATTKLSAKIKAPLTALAYPKLESNLLKKSAKIDSALIHAIIRQESRFKPDALSSAGAMGLMQLMPETAKITAKKFNLPLGHLHKEDINVSIGSHHLKDLLQKYTHNLTLVAAAYNAGSNSVDRWIALYGDPRTPGVDPHDWVELIPYAETRNYVQRVHENYQAYMKL